MKNFSLPKALILWPLSLLLVQTAVAARPTFEIAIENHLFVPSTIEVPAGKKVKLIVHNKDGTPEEFESYELNREKIIVGNQKAIIFIGPLDPGEYPFFGEFHPNTALGTIIAVESTK